MFNFIHLPLWFSEEHPLQRNMSSYLLSIFCLHYVDFLTLGSPLHILDMSPLLDMRFINVLSLQSISVDSLDMGFLTTQGSSVNEV